MLFSCYKRKKVGREKRGAGGVLTKPFAVTLMWTRLKGAGEGFGGKNSLNRLFNRTHRLCMAARRLFHSLLPSIVTAKRLAATAGTPDLSDWISAISGARCLKRTQVMAGQALVSVRCENVKASRRHSSPRDAAASSREDVRPQLNLLLFAALPGSGDIFRAA